LRGTYRIMYKYNVHTGTSVNVYTRVRLGVPECA
jgi:hypothetical protein